MKTIIEINDINSTLREYFGAKAKIWAFNVTHKKLFLQLHHPNKEEIIYLVAIGCEQITGPFSWKSAKIHIEEDKRQSSEIDSLIIDEDAEFRLITSGGVIIAFDLENGDADA